MHNNDNDNNIAKICPDNKKKKLYKELFPTIEQPLLITNISHQLCNLASGIFLKIIFDSFTDHDRMNHL